MLRYASRRLMAMFPTLLVVSAITFFGLNVLPGDIALLYLDRGDPGAGSNLQETQEYITAFNEKFGLDEPVLKRYVSWLGGMATGDPGLSMRTERPIWPELEYRLPVTLHIVAFSFIFSVVFGVVSGVLSAALQDTVWDYGVRVFAVFADSFPNFFLLTLLLLVPAILWGYAPPTGYAGPIWQEPWIAIRQFVPPALLLSLGSAFLVRITRSSMLEVLRGDYIRTARAKGLNERTVILRHALKNSMIPVITICGSIFASLLGGSIILENVMGLPGVGTYAFQAVQVRDFNVVQATTMYSAVVVMVVYLVVDLSYAWFDPRIRYQ